MIRVCELFGEDKDRLGHGRIILKGLRGAIGLTGHLLLTYSRSRANKEEQHREDLD